MTHAYFKALLFMAAGSIISAMAGEQSLDRMGGFRKAMPFTFICFIVGGLALSGLPPFSGWLSKDDIIGYLDNRGGGFLILGIAGYVGAFLTGVYTFRMIFRAFFGDPVPEAVELEHGHLAHAEVPTNPQTGEEEDTEVGFPGAEHHIAERDLAMKVPMTILAILAVIGGFLQIPGVDDGIARFLEPTFATSHLYRLAGSVGNDWLGLVIGALVAVAGIGTAYRLYIARPGTSTALMTRFRALHTFLYNKWYFDELIDLLVVRPAQWMGRFLGGVAEPGFIGAVFTGGTTGVVRACSAAVRRAQTGFLRYYAAVVIVGLSGMALYFLISAA
jgi:NADH-quinone oxidoreductase subunit L